jgi:hypothetical protein
MRVAVLGNSGSGKSTLARWIAGYTYAPLLDLDTVVWELGKIAVARSPEAARSDLHAFCSAKNHGSLKVATLRWLTRRLSTHRSSFFSTQVKANASVTAGPDLGRPTSTHHAQSKINSCPSCSPGSVSTTRDTDMSLTGHQACFDAYTGRKVEVTVRPQLDPPSAEVLAWLN